MVVAKNRKGWHAERSLSAKVLNEVDIWVN